MPKKKLLQYVLHFQIVTVRSWLTPANKGERGVPDSPLQPRTSHSLKDASTSTAWPYAVGILTTVGVLNMKQNETLGIWILSSVLFSTAGCSGTDSKEHLLPEPNSCQYSLLNNKAGRLPKDFFEKITLEKREWLEAGNMFLSFKALTANLIISLFFTL